MRAAIVRPVVVVTMASLCALHGAHAQSRDPNRLGTELTSSGAEKGATADGIPAWSAPEPQGSGWTYGKRRGDFFKYKSDKPLYSIDASNVDKYADKLSPGQLLLLKELKGYRMDVYPSRRTCGVPDFVAENTKKNVAFARMAPDGVSLQDAHTPGFPFPFPQNGAEAMWNMKLRYRGLGLEMRGVYTSLSPRKGSNEWIKAAQDVSALLPWGVKTGTTFAKVDQVEASVYFAYTSPAALAGQGVMITTGAAKPPETFYYFPGQRRVRRMPAYSYDAPQIGFENQYNIDEPSVFSGPLDRFDWKLVGKKEMLVAYNSFGQFDINAKLDDVMLRDFLSPASRRYELHRVWVVEASVRQGMRHSSPKRTFYLDEDSWAPLGAVDYDAQGKIWKVREGYAIPVYETGTCDVTAFVQYNVTEGRYVADSQTVGSVGDIHWLVEGAGNTRLKQDFYTSENLRAISER